MPWALPALRTTNASIAPPEACSIAVADRIGAQGQAADSLEVESAVSSRSTDPTSGAARWCKVIRRRSM